MIARGFSSFTKLSENRLTFCRQCSCDSIHSVSCSLNAGRSRKRCFVVSEDRRRPVDPRARVDQVGGIELVPAVVALVAARALEAADRARALDVAVGKRVPGRGGERPERLLLDDVALSMERAEEVLGDAVVVGGRRPREEVVREPEVAKILADELVEAVGGLTRRLAGGVRRDHDRRPVLVRPAHHEDVVAAQPVIAGERVRRNAEARHVADVAQAARIRPRDRDQDLPSGARSAHRGRMIWSRFRTPLGDADAASREKYEQRQRTENRGRAGATSRTGALSGSGSSAGERTSARAVTRDRRSARGVDRRRVDTTDVPLARGRCRSSAARSAGCAHPAALEPRRRAHRSCRVSRSSSRAACGPAADRRGDLRSRP